MTFRRNNSNSNRNRRYRSIVNMYTGNHHLQRATMLLWALLMCAVEFEIGKYNSSLVSFFHTHILYALSMPFLHIRSSFFWSLLSSKLIHKYVHCTYVWWKHQHELAEATRKLTKKREGYRTVEEKEKKSIRLGKQRMGQWKNVTTSSSSTTTTTSYNFQ